MPQGPDTKSPFSWGDTIDCEKAMYGNNSLKHDVCQLYIQSIESTDRSAGTGENLHPQPLGVV